MFHILKKKLFTLFISIYSLSLFAAGAIDERTVEGFVCPLKTSHSYVVKKAKKSLPPDLVSSSLPEKFDRLEILDLSSVPLTKKEIGCLLDYYIKNDHIRYLAFDLRLRGYTWRQKRRLINLILGKIGQKFNALEGIEASDRCALHINYSRRYLAAPVRRKIRDCLKHAPTYFSFESCDLGNEED